MTTQNNPAFPHTLPGHQIETGMTLRQYAAIKLKVPDSGEGWLDDMIRKSLLNDFAGQAMQGIISAWGTGVPPTKETSDAAFHFANAILAAKDIK